MAVGNVAPRRASVLEQNDDVRWARASVASSMPARASRLTRLDVDNHRVPYMPMVPEHGFLATKNETLRCGYIRREKPSNMKIACLSTAILSSASLALAAAEEYYIAQDISTKQCMIVESPPATTELVLLENGQVFFDRAEAERVLISLSLCTLKTVSARASPEPRRAERIEKNIQTKARTSTSKSSTRAATKSEDAISQSPFTSLFILFR